MFGNVKQDRFPLLVKIIDARENLSIQVHPDIMGKHGIQEQNIPAGMITGKICAPAFYDLLIPECGVLYDPLLSLIIDIYNTEALLIAQGRTGRRAGICHQGAGVS